MAYQSFDEFARFDELSARIGETDYDDESLNHLRDDLLRLVELLAVEVKRAACNEAPEGFKIE